MEDRHLMILLLLSFAVATLRGEFISECPKECKCAWVYGNKEANCSNSQLQDVPNTLSTEIQNIDLSGNELNEIKRDAFMNTGLINLKKLILRECKLETIHNNGFEGLDILILLDLSKNELKTLDSETFQNIKKIRWILLNDNKLEKLEDGLFNNLPFLSKLDLSNNRIVTIGIKTFVNVPTMSILHLDGNNLETLNIDTLSALTTLSNIDVHDNPWRCDCNVQPLRNWVIGNDLFTAPITCQEPPNVRGRTWQELNSSDFACRPSIIYPSANTTLRSDAANVTLSCQVNGNPLPEVNWVLNAQKIDGSNKKQGNLKYYLSESSDANSRWVNLTIVDASVTDNGEYLCMAKNAIGVEERKFTLVSNNLSEFCKNLRLDPSMSIYYCSICSCK